MRFFGILIGLACASATTVLQTSLHGTSASSSAIRQRIVVFAENSRALSIDDTNGRVCVRDDDPARYVVRTNGVVQPVMAQPAASFDILYQIRTYCIANISCNGECSLTVNASSNGTVDWAFEFGDDSNDGYFDNLDNALMIGITTIQLHVSWNRIWAYALIAPIAAVIAIVIVSWKSTSASRILAATALTLALSSTADRLLQSFYFGIDSEDHIFVLVLCVVLDVPLWILTAILLRRRGLCSVVCDAFTLVVAIVALFTLGSGYLLAPAFLILAVIVHMFGDVCVVQTIKM